MPPTKKSRQTEAAEAVRAAVDQTFQATLGARGRAQELVDEVSTAASRVRDALEDVRLATGDDVKDLSKQIRALEKRVAELEGKQSKPTPKRSKPKPKPKPTKR